LRLCEGVLLRVDLTCSTEAGDPADSCGAATAETGQSITVADSASVIFRSKAVT
jgi:hypothetical protein